MQFVKKFSKAVLLFFVIIFTGCNNYFEILSSRRSFAYSSDRKDQLIEIALTNKWKSSDQEVQDALLAVFKNESRFAKGMLTQITKIDESSMTIPVPFSRNRSAIMEECNKVNFGLYFLETENKNWYAITSDDKRVGNVLALIESEFSRDISDNDFSIMFAERLNNYILNVADEWNSLTADDISDYKARSAYKDIVNNGNYTYSAWKKNYGNTKCQIPVNWNQRPSPFNNCIVAVIGGDAYYVGCGAVQVAQIMAYHKYIKENTSPNFNLIKSKWAQAGNWDGKYDFDVLTSVKYPYSYFPEKVRTQLGAFLFDVAEGCKSEYKSNETITYENNRLSYLKSQGYAYSCTSDYSFENIKTSIDAGCPVPICGYSKKTVTTTTHRFLWWTWTTSNTWYSGGHAFIIDGYYNMSCTATDGTNTITISDNFVHCNPGWGGFGNGYYLDDVFNFGVGALVDDSGIRAANDKPYYYQYKLSQTNMLKPTGR